MQNSQAVLPTELNQVGEGSPPVVDSLRSLVTPENCSQDAAAAVKGETASMPVDGPAARSLLCARYDESNQAAGAAVGSNSMGVPRSSNTVSLVCTKRTASVARAACDSGKCSEGYRN